MENINKKICTDCNEEKSLNEFYWREATQNYIGYCNKCRSVKRAKYKEINKEKLKLQNEEYRGRPEVKLATRIRSRKHYHTNREKILQNGKETYRKNIESIKLQHKKNRQRPETKAENRKKYKNNINLQLNYRISRSINAVLNEEQKTSSKLKSLGYSIDDLKKHLESKFTGGMSWENFIRNIDIDHIIPLKAFEFNSYEDEAFKLCWSLENLQPLFKSNNSSKKDMLPCGILARNTTLKIHTLADYNSVKAGGLPLAYF